MPALTAGRQTARRSGDLLTLPVAASKICYGGGLACRDASGNATPGATATTLKALGAFRETVYNATGSAGAVNVEIEKGIFRFANSAAGDLIARADIGNDCYIVDDQTVAATHGTNTRSVAGKIFDVDAQGVWVDLR